MRGECFYRTNSAISRTAALKFSLHEALTLSAYLNKTLKDNIWVKLNTWKAECAKRQIFEGTKQYPSIKMTFWGSI